MNGSIFKKSPGRPPMILEQCSELMKRTTGDKVRLNKYEVISVKAELASRGYGKEMINKARKNLGYKAYQILDYPMGVIWRKEEL